MAEVRREVLVDALTAAAICHTGSQADAATALIRAAAEILCWTLTPTEVAQFFVDSAGQAAAMTAPAGQA